MEIAGKGLAACLAAAFLYCALFRDGRPAAGGKEYGCFAAPPQAENHGRQDSLFLGDRKRGEKKDRRRAAILAFAVAVGFLRMAAASGKEEIVKKEGSPGFSALEATVSGTVDRIQEKNGSGSAELVDVLAEVGRGTREERSYRLDRLIVYLPGELSWEEEWTEKRERRLLPGMKLFCEGELESFEPARNEGEFDYRLYYQSKNICCRMSAERAVAADGEPSPLKAGAYLFKERGRAVFERFCSQRDAGLLSAVVLGDKTGMDEEISDLYQKNGIAHLLAVSGLHVSLIGMGFYRALRRWGMGFGQAGLWAGGLLFCYGIMTGFGPSVFRACLMLGCSFLAAWLGKTYDLLSAMALAAIILALQSPYVIATAAFQLSFGAVFAIGWAGKELTDSFRCRRGWTRALAVSAAIQLVTGPLVLWHFFEYPVYGILLNFIVIPLMTYVVGAGLAGLFLGLMAELFSACSFSAVFEGLFGLLAAGSMGTCHYILAFYEWLCRAVGKLPIYSLILGRPALWKLAAYYLMLSVLLWRTAKRGRRADEQMEEEPQKEERPARGEENRQKNRTGRPWREKAELLKTAAAILSLIGFLVCRQPEICRVDFIDVGQGDGILIQSEKTVILVDGGSTQIRGLGEKRLEPVLKSRGISRIGMAFVSHGDQDHISGLSWLLENDTGIEIDQLFLPAAGRGDPIYEELEEAAKRRGTRTEYICAGNKFQAGKLKITCLYPRKDTVSADRNGHSEVLLAEYGSFSMLLMGDAGAEAEEEISEKWEQGKQVQVLKAGHHGSSASSCGLFLDTVKPALAVLSYGKGNSYGHPHKEVLERMSKRGISIWPTAEQGMVTVRTDGEKVQVKGFVRQRQSLS